jgi:CHAT domain-containing protein
MLLARLRRLDAHLHKRAAVKRPTAAGQQQRQHLLEQQLEAQDDLATLARELEEKYGPVAGQVLGLKEVQKALPPDGAYLAWLDVGGAHWAVLLRDRGGPIWARLPGTGPGKSWIRADAELPGQAREALGREGSDWRPLVQKLREQRLAPLAGHLKGARHLVVLPSAAMDGVPVEVIAEGKTVSYALSASLFAQQRGQPGAKSAGLVALGDPVFMGPGPRDGAGWRPLPGTRHEVRALEALFADQRATVLLGSDASAAKLAGLAGDGTLGRARYVHLATHGQARSDRPWASRVILARDRPGADEGGELSAAQVLGWELKAELVVLSACQSGLGKHARGESFLGFTQALQLAGARSVCLSRWSVDDLSTALLMERFYQNLLGKRPGLKAPLGKAAALHEAKDWLRGLSARQVQAESERLTRGKSAKPVPLRKEAKPFAHPYYWAPFVLVGDPR